MTSHASRHLHRRIGFTIIELLVVIAIIAVLMGLLFPVIGRVRRAAYAASTSAQLSTIANAIQQYQGDFQAYPGPLSNIQVGYANYDISIQNTTQPPFVPDPQSPQPKILKVMSNGTAQNFQDVGKITGAENLVLGLLGGLEIIVNQGGGITSFDYNSLIIFPDQTGPAPKGALQLNPAKPRRWAAYLDVKPGQISHPDFTNNRGKFIDEANRVADDTVIPEFIDQFPEGLPILYIRANVGGTAVCGLGGKGATGSLLADQNGQTVTPQYDLAGVIGYTKFPIGTVANKVNLSKHALQDVGDMTTDSISDSNSTQSRISGIDPTNGVAYFKDPANPGTSNEQGGNARQKNGYILISPGPDRIYGTADDIIYPGSLQP